MQWRIDSLGPARATGSPEVLQALETTMEELRVAVEELRRTNEALLDSRAEVEAERRRYLDLFELAPDAYLVTDLLGVIREANREAMNQLNIDFHFLLGKPFWVFLPEPDRPGFRTRVLKLRDEPKTFEFDVKLKPRRLPAFDASIRVGVVRDPWGRAVALRWTIRDVSARKRAEEEIKDLNEQLQGQIVERSEQLESSLQTNERWLIKAYTANAEADDDADVEDGGGGSFFRDIVEEVDAILWRADAGSGRYTFVSRRAEELLGYPTSRWLDDPEFWLSSIHPEDRNLVANRRKQLREGVDHENEYRVIAADGRTLWFREAVRVLAEKPDNPASLYGLMVNISRRKKVERQLQTAKGELTSQLRDLSYLHDLGRRLANARGVAATLDEVLSAVVSLQGAEMAMVWLFEPGPGPPMLAAGFGLPEEFARWAKGQDPGPGLIPRGPLAIEDVTAQPETSPWREAGRVAGFRAVNVAPLMSAADGPIGAIVTTFNHPYRMSEGQARLTGMYATQAAEAIEAARTLERLERSDRRKAEAFAAIEEPLASLLDALDPADPAEARDAIERQLLRLRQLINGG